MPIQRTIAPPADTLTDKGRRTLEPRVESPPGMVRQVARGLGGRRSLAAFAEMLGRFATSLERDLEDAS